MRTVLVGLVFVSILVGTWWFSAAEHPDLSAAGPAEVSPAAELLAARAEVYSVPELAVEPRAAEAREREPAAETVSARRTTRLGAAKSQVLRDASGNSIGGIITTADGSVRFTSSASIDVDSYVNQGMIETGSYRILLDDAGTLVSIASKPHPDGLNTSYHSGGEKSSEGWIQDGKRIGPWTEWHADGKRKSEGEYYYGERHGFWTTWNSAGKRESAGEYLYGKQEGHWTTWHANGERHTQTEYRNGKPESWGRTWHPSGRLASEGPWRDGKHHGRWSTYHPSGELESRGDTGNARVRGSSTILKRLSTWSAVELTKRA